jgi:NADH dehydrogenase [ubiquinone] 1 alpha subcomplex assembly factor 7
MSVVPHGPLLLVANEFLDALPVRQFADGVERKVIAAAGGLAFDRDGEIVETSPARDLAVSPTSPTASLLTGVRR